jgi:recombination protein RecT
MTTDIVSVKANTFNALLEKSRDQIERALPKHVTAERMMRLALTEARRIPKLLDCDQISLMGAVIQAAQLGLEPGGVLGHCYLIPFKGQVQFIVGYRGMLELAMRSPLVEKITARAVYEGDEFVYEFGLGEKLVHKPKMTPHKDAQLTYVYAVVFLKDGSKQFDVMSRDDVDAIRARSMAANSGPWVSDYEAMAKKTVVRRLFKFTPVSIEIQQAVGLDEAAERGEQDNSKVINVEGHHVGQEKANEFKERLKAPKIESPIKPVMKEVDNTPPIEIDSFNNFQGEIVK